MDPLNGPGRKIPPACVHGGVFIQLEDFLLYWRRGVAYKTTFQTPAGRSAGQFSLVSVMVVHHGTGKGRALFLAVPALPLFELRFAHLDQEFFRAHVRPIRHPRQGCQRVHALDRARGPQPRFGV